MATKKYIFIGTLLLASVSQQASAQSDVTGVPGHIRQPNFYVGWNGQGGNPGSLDIRNDFASQPIQFYTGTNGTPIPRMMLNGAARNYPVNAQPLDPLGRDGFLLLGRNAQMMSNSAQTLYANLGAFSLLHLNGEGSAVQEFGYRNWMRTGITFTGNRDLSYIGLRKLDTNATTEDITETTIAWTDNLNQDDLVFRFIGNGGNNQNVVTNNFASNQDLDGLHVARFTAGGLMGLGSTFGVNAGGMSVGYVAPQNLLHMSLDGTKPVFLQITNQSGTGQTATDGLKIGYNATASNNQEAVINQQENDRLSLYTNNGERMRITHTGALNGGTAFNPGGLPNNLTRIGISHNPASPITRPLSLLHLGYNTQSNPPSPLLPNENGWRRWMDVGMFVLQESDNVYLGLKDEGKDRKDAVLVWGDNQAGSEGPDNFRIIFASNPIGLEPATDENGLEALRMTPTINILAGKSNIFTGIGGSPSDNPYSTLTGGTGENPTQTLEVNAWGNLADNNDGGNAGFGQPTGNSGLRFTDLNASSVPQTNPGRGVLALNKLGDVIYVPGGGGNSVGDYCDNNPAPLANDYTINLGSSRNYYFAGQAPLTGGGTNSVGSSVGIGLDCGTAIPVAKLQVVQSSFNTNGSIYSSVAGEFDNNADGKTAIGVLGLSYGEGPTENVGGAFSITKNITTIQRIHNFVGDSKIGGYCYNPVSYDPHQLLLSAALYVDGDAIFTGNVFGSQNNWTTSDSIFKTNVNGIHSALDIVNKLKPVTYNFDESYNSRFHFSAGLNYGFIAQDVAHIVPELVKETVAPAEKDSSENIIKPSFSYKALNYIGIIPILTKAIQEQQAQITGKDSIINALNDRLTKLEKCIDAAGLCSTRSTTPKSLTTSNTDVELKDVQAIILDQNVPNPFAEQTVISYFLPEEVNKAQMLFYNGQGKLINTIDITQKGNGQITVFAQDLSSGIYTYTLVVDGKVFETKKMVKQ